MKSYLSLTVLAIVYVAFACKVRLSESDVRANNIENDGSYFLEQIDFEKYEFAGGAVRSAMAEDCKDKCRSYEKNKGTFTGTYLCQFEPDEKQENLFCRVFKKSKITL